MMLSPLLWKRRIKTMVRYRLLWLNSVPLFLTLLALVIITAFWSVHYTWQNALNDVGSKLSVADNSINFLQQEQSAELRGFVESYQFQTRLKNNDKNLQRWSVQQADKYNSDFIVVHPISYINHLPDSSIKALSLGISRTFFQVMNKDELSNINPQLSTQVSIVNKEDGSIESRSLIIRTLIPIFDDHGNLVWIVDSGIILNNSTFLVDRIRDLIYPEGDLDSDSYGTVTLFLDDLRISTNVPLHNDFANKSLNQGRAIGTKVSLEVKKRVIENGERWVNRAYVYNDWYISAYQPIKDMNDNIIGMLYTGYLEWPLLKQYLQNLVEAGVTILITLLLSTIFVHRGARDLFQPIEKIHYVVKSVQMGKEVRIGDLGLDNGHELASLAQQFDNMLDQLQQRNMEIQHASKELESKVESRTASLHEKTIELEQYIKLLKQAQDKLIMSEKLASLGELTAGIAHEINNPTAVILGNAELIKYELGEGADVISEELEAIMEQIDRIRNITRSLLQYSRQGGIQDEVTWQYINPIIEESVTLVRTGSNKRDIEVEFDFQQAPRVEVNRHHLLQVLVNLQMNGIHAMNSKGKLIIRSRTWSEEGIELGAIIEIEDFGTGMNLEQLNRIFDPFYTTKRDGTGLGLSVSQSLLSQTGGEIKARSELGVGSTFIIYLPTKSEHHQYDNLVG
ncbi:MULTISPECIES: HAMP domain-containing sensor histidine kinase [unclassified Aliivibrio]|uniref:sensor histidine kinase n=1 Tax=unclassified Aliivibrio TaxID=2645654 RepID=UPI00080DFB5C|nr:MULTISPECIES: HAMP domain-containing sensor histidine kinase [unclassified Aliivibrio]OCH18973.1 two-component sensor histidine kinase [Aliivibrio sp. 1S165]OCH19850.1 two-component sensor histidine kinase [Aliivibrio sp. 1S128]OCH30832.1 two-component sensor histidine kinase [Aliivibrio sp. 1S175]